MSFRRAAFRFSPGPSRPTVPPWIQFLACLSRIAVAKLQLHPYLYLTNEPLWQHLPPPRLHPTLYQTSIFPLTPASCFAVSSARVPPSIAPGAAPGSLPVISYPQMLVFTIPFIPTHAWASPLQPGSSRRGGLVGKGVYLKSL